MRIPVSVTGEVSHAALIIIVLLHGAQAPSVSMPVCYPGGVQVFGLLAATESKLKGDNNEKICLKSSAGPFCC